MVSRIFGRLATEKLKCNDPLKPKYKIFILRFHYSNNLLRANKILPFVPPDFMKIGVSISSFLQEVPIVYYTDKHFDKLSPNLKNSCRGYLIGKRFEILTSNLMN